jgi:S1-C subfamily serine protease
MDSGGPTMGNTIERIIIRHLAGSKANQIEQLPVGEAREFTIGRDPASTIAFDPASDSVVSRQHAVIRMNVDGDKIGFELADHGSSNGTYLNGERIERASELLPEDVIELGKKGPRFVFDIQPRPVSLVARTRTIDADIAATRAMDTARFAAAATASPVASAASGGSTGASTAVAKRGVGQETVQRLIGAERRASRRTLVASVAGLVAFLVLGGGALLWKQWSDEQRLRGHVTEVKTDIEKGIVQTQEDLSAAFEPKVKAMTGMSAQEIYDKYANATAKIFLQWRLYDKTTGKPIYHQTHSVRIDKTTSQILPAYVRLRNGAVVRWLTTEDDYRSNYEVGQEGTGSGFVVGEQGYLLTNKHVAAGWEIPYRVPRRDGVLYEIGGGPGAPAPQKGDKGPDLRQGILIDLDNALFDDVNNWLPETGGVIFPTRVAVPIGRGNVIPDPNRADKHTFAGRNEVLGVRFPGSRVDIAASLVRFSPDADAALIKIDSPQVLETVELAADDKVTIGEKIIVLGYPGISVENFQTQESREMGDSRSRTEMIPEATVTDGIVSKLASGVKNKDGVTLSSSLGDTIQLSVLATGAGNSGGPVLNANGKVIGLFTYMRTRGSERVTFAIPIKYGRDLLRAQRE